MRERVVKIGPGSWVRCIRVGPTSEIHAGSVYKVLSVEMMDGPCNGPPEHHCQQVGFLLAGVTLPHCSKCFAPILPSGSELLNPLLGKTITQPKPPRPIK